MNLGDLAHLGQIIGAVAVVISLFYVAQIQQTLVQKIVQGTMRIDNFFDELVFTCDWERNDGK